MRDVSAQVEEIYKFLSEYRAESPPKGAAASKLKTAYKKVHAVLIWQKSIDGNAYYDRDIKLYMNEATADLAQSMLCSLFGLYKPSSVMLRAHLENAMRVATMLCGMKPLEAKTVHDLAVLFKSTSLRSNPDTDAAVQAILQQYAHLCDYVHTSSPMNMDLRIPLSSIVESDEVKSSNCLDGVLRAASALNKTLSFLCAPLLAGMHHRDADYIRDQLPARLKQKIAQGE